MFIQNRYHLALVVNNENTLTGLVTLEDAIETLLGEEIVDEHDSVVDMRDLAKSQKVNLEEISITQLADQFIEFINNLDIILKSLKRDPHDPFDGSSLTPSKVIECPELKKMIKVKLIRNAKRIDKFLINYLKKQDRSLLINPMKYGIISGGKKIRSKILVDICSLLSIDYKTLIAIGTAVECIHAYSLIHDDLPCMDNDDYRRNKLSFHKKLDQWSN